MSFKIVYLPIAEQDLGNIADYLSNFYSSTFKSFIVMLEKSIANLQAMPYIGVKYRNYHKLIVSEYLIFYQVDENENIVKIYRILHSLRDSELEKFKQE